MKHNIFLTLLALLVSNGLVQAGGGFLVPQLEGAIATMPAQYINGQVSVEANTSHDNIIIKEYISFEPVEQLPVNETVAADHNPFDNFYGNRAPVNPINENGALNAVQPLLNNDVNIRTNRSVSQINYLSNVAVDNVEEYNFINMRGEAGRGTVTFMDGAPQGDYGTSMPSDEPYEEPEINLYQNLLEEGDEYESPAHDELANIIAEIDAMSAEEETVGEESILEESLAEKSLPEAFIPTSKISIEAWPNPSSGTFSLRMPQTAAEKNPWQISNLQGKVVASGTTSPNAQFSIDLSQQPRGVYLFQATDGQQRVSQKLILQ